MRNLFIIIILTLVFALCSHRENAIGRLEAIAETVAEKPQAALDSVALFGSPAPGSEAEALCALITAQARYELYVDEVSDSVIDIAARYYLSRPVSDRRKMTVCYLRGFTRDAVGRSAEGVSDLLEAETYALKLGDHKQLGLIYTNLSAAFGSAFCFGEQLDYARRAAAEYLVFGDSSYIDYSRLELAAAYNNNGMFDASESIADSLLAAYPPGRDASMRNEALSLKATARSRKGDSAGAARCLLENFNGGSGPMDRQQRTLLLKSLCEAGNRPLADSLYRVFVANSEEVLAPEELYLDGEKDYRKAYEACVEHYNYLNEKFVESIRQSVRKSFSDRLERQKVQAELRAKRNRTVVYVLVFAGVVAALFAGWYYRRKKKKAFEREAELMAEASALARELENAINDSKPVNECLKSILTNYYTELDRLCSKYMTAIDANGRSSKVPDKVESLLKELGRDAATRRSLIEAINLSFNNVVEKFDSDFPKIGENERLVFIYGLLGLSPKSIAVVLSQSVGSVYSHRSRLRKKIDSLPPEKAAFYVAFI